MRYMPLLEKNFNCVPPPDIYWRLTIIIVALILQSCAQHVVVVTPSTPASKEVVILVSENIPAYSNVAEILAKQLGRRGSIRFLNGNQFESIKMLAAYKNDENKQFVSIGLNASLAAKTLTDRQVVFCQVFNYKDYQLVTAKHKGVSMIPSMPKTFRTWRALAPNTTDIGVISGPGFEDMLQLAKATANNYGITLHHKIVHSDKEYQYAYKQMANEVQGYWLVPDNRVLSGNTLRDVMTFSVRNGKQVVVFSEELLNLGGLFSTISDHQDIAHEVLHRLEQAQDIEVIPGPDIVYLDKSILRINTMMAQRLNLEIPAQYRK